MNLISQPVNYPNAGVSAVLTLAGSLIIVSESGDIAIISTRDFSKGEANVRKAIRDFATCALNNPTPKASAKLSSPAHWAKYLRLSSEDLEHLANS